jgi:hypothetical protein
MINRICLCAALMSSLLVTACGGGGGGSGDDEPTPMGTFHHYVVNRVIAPTSETSDQIIQVDHNAHPVESGGQYVNALGGLLGTLAAGGSAGSGGSLQDGIDKSVNDGDVILLADFQTTDYGSAPAAGLQIFKGTNPMPAPCNGSADTTCGNQLTGSGSFDVDTTTTFPAVAGPIVGGKFAGGPGEIDVSFALSFGGGSSTTLDLDLKDAHAQLSSISDTGFTTGIIGGAITQDDINTKLIPTVAQIMQGIVVQDCTDLTDPPGCGCPSGSTAATLLTVGDTTPADCNITPAELMTGVVAGLLSPDVALDNASAPNALSVAIGVTAVGATYTVPGEGSGSAQ